MVVVAGVFDAVVVVGHAVVHVVDNVVVVVAAVVVSSTFVCRRAGCVDFFAGMC